MKTIPGSLLLFALALPAAGGETTRVSVDVEGSVANGASHRPAISASGRYVAFWSGASDLVLNDGNGSLDVFVRDVESGVTVCASVGPTGELGDGPSQHPAISADGRFVAFMSMARNLVADDFNGQTDVFVFDRDLGTTVRASVDENGLEGSGGSLFPAISGDGRFVAFMSYATEFIPGATEVNWDIFIKDMQTGAVHHASRTTSGERANGPCTIPSLSADGRFVVFPSAATNLAAGDPNDRDDVFLHDVLTGETECVSVDSAGVIRNGRSGGGFVSADGRFVVFDSTSTMLVPGDANGSADVFLRDRSAGTTECLSVDASGDPANDESRAAGISSDGRYALIASKASNLVPDDMSNLDDAFVRDLVLRRTRRVSVATDGSEANAGCFLPCLSASGHAVAFGSAASNLVGDGLANTDVFLRVESCALGSVNAGAGPLADVLFVNDSAGGWERRLEFLTHEPLTIFMGLPPASAGAVFALYAYGGEPNEADAFSAQFGVGSTCLPTPLTGGSPRIRAIWNNTGRSVLGNPTRPSTPAPSTVASFPSGTGAPMKFFLQGFIADPASAGTRRGSVTNGVTVIVR